MALGVVGAGALARPINSLISYHYFRDSNIAAMKSWGLCMIGDSGAFSAFSAGKVIDPDDFYAWADRWQDSLYWTASLDVIGDIEASWRNWRDSPQHLRLVPTVHFGADPRVIDRYVEGGADLIGLGGMVPYKMSPKRLLRWCLSVMVYARKTHPHVRFHGWGVNNPDVSAMLPWWSVDSSKYSMVYRYGQLLLFDPEQRKKRAVYMNGRDSAEVYRLLATYYGVNWKDILRSHKDNRPLLVHVAIRATQYLQADLQQRHHVTAPPSLAGVMSQGPTVHVALSKNAVADLSGMSTTAFNIAKESA